MSARCIECGGRTITRHDGTLVLQHTDPECTVASDPELMCRETTRLSDILVPVTFGDIEEDFKATIQVGSIATNSEYHVVAHIPEKSDQEAFFFEARGRVQNFQSLTGYILVTFSPGHQGWVYKASDEQGVPVPDQSSGLSVTGLYLGLSVVYRIPHSSEVAPQVHRIHVPSALVPTARG